MVFSLILSSCGKPIKGTLNKTDSKFLNTCFLNNIFLTEIFTVFGENLAIFTNFGDT